MRKKRLFYNTASSLIFQIVNIICGFIVPRLILQAYGSEVNGLTTSITRFLQIIAFLDMGVGAVVQSSFYKPLADNDHTLVSQVFSSADKFFRRLAEILLGYVVILLCFYPTLIAKGFPYLYTATLIVAISVSFFAQYFFGMANKLLLYADQRGYVEYIAHTVTVILNTISCVILIHFKAPIQIVRMSTSVVFLLRPLVLRRYVIRHYAIDRKIKYTGEPIKQKWNGLAQHIASVVLDDTDTIVLSMFSTMASVSIYSVYHLVVYGVRNLFTVMTNGIQSMWGEMWAKEEKKELKQSFLFTEWLIHMGTVFVFGCMGCLIVPFVQVYTKGIEDANYVVPVFACVISIAYGIHCLRLPYHIMIKAVGHYKQTQSNYIVAATANILVSVLAVRQWGLVGVAIGTLCAMAYQTFWMAWYNATHILSRPLHTFGQLIFIDVLCSVASSALSLQFRLSSITYSAWTLLAMKTAAVWMAVIILANFIFYRNNLMYLIRFSQNRDKREKNH